MASELTSKGIKASMIATQPRWKEEGSRQSVDAATRLRISALTSWVFLKRFETSKEMCALRQNHERDPGQSRLYARREPTKTGTIDS